MSTATDERVRPELPTWKTWEAMSRAERVEAALVLIIDAVEHEARDRPYSWCLQSALTVAKDAINREENG